MQLALNHIFIIYTYDLHIVKKRKNKLLDKLIFKTSTMTKKRI